MYFDAVITPVALGGSPGIIKPQIAGKKKLTKAQSRNDTDQPSPSRLTLGRPHTATQPVSLSPPSQPRPRSSSNTLSRPPSIKKKSMSFVSLFFNKTVQPSGSNTSSSFIDVEEKQTNIFKRSKTTVDTGTPPSLPSRPRTHRLSRSFSNSLNYHVKDNDSNGQESLHSHPFTPAPFSVTPSPTMTRRFEHASKRSSESCTNVPRTKSPSSAFRQGLHGKGSPSASLHVIDADAFHFDDDDACSAISSICFADDPDEKPPNKGKGHESSIATVSPVTRLDRDSVVLDISASNRILDELGDITESAAQAKEDNDIAQTCHLPYRTKDKLLSILGEFPQHHQQTHQRRHSCSTASVSSTTSRWSTSCPPSAELSPAWSLPDIPVVSPLTTTTFVPSLTTQPLIPTKSSPPTNSPSNPIAVTRKRRSTLLFPGTDGLTAFLRPIETSDTKRLSRPFRSSTFSSSSSSSPLPTRFDLSVPPTSLARTLVPQSHPNAPPGLNAHVQRCSCGELDVENEDKKGKNREYRDSVMTQDSSFSDLHRLPSSLLDDDSPDTQSVRFNTAPSTPTLLPSASPSLPTSSAPEPSAQSPASSFANTAHISHPTIIISSSHTPSPTGTSTPTHTTSPTPPLSISPPRHSVRPLPPRPKPSSIRSFTSLSPLNLPPTASTGIEHIIDPVDSPFDPAVSPIVFASDSDDYSFERYPRDFSDDDSVEIGSWGSQDGMEPLLEREKVRTKGRADRKADVEAKRKQRMEENSGWSSVRVPLRKKSSGPVVGGETANWVGEWNSDMHDVIQQLRTLR